jgi:hypothetical protein
LHILTKGAKPAPWTYIRTLLAKEWYTQPWEVDRIREEAPYEITRQIEIWRIESTAHKALRAADEAIAKLKRGGR